MDPAHERELVERCRRGDEGAFQELVDQYKDLVFALIARTVQDRSRAEDLAQDALGNDEDDEDGDDTGDDEEE